MGSDGKGKFWLEESKAVQENIMWMYWSTAKRFLPEHDKKEVDVGLAAKKGNPRVPIINVKCSEVVHRAERLCILLPLR